SLEVPFNESLGYHLSQLLGTDVQVLNFGIAGFGLDQVRLRYKRDVRSWMPKVVMIVLIQHDLVRSMVVYPFISLGWMGYLVKPRCGIKDGRLVQVNAPLPKPIEILGAGSPAELPYVEYDPGVARTDWSWRFERGPMTMRLLTSLLPPWPSRMVRGRASEETLNEMLLSDLYGQIVQDGATPILVYLPQRVGSDEL